MDLARYLDSTNLKPEATEKDIRMLCEEAANFEMAAVCIQPYRLPLAKSVLAGSGVKLCTVIGFPLGAEMAGLKAYSARKALEAGADELDMVLNIGALKDHDYSLVRQEMEEVLAFKHELPFVFKLIVETALLTPTELIYLTQMLSDSEADFIKTSTGFSTRGASLEDIQIINEHKSDRLKVKASGGIRTLEFARQLLSAGVDRLGTSNARKIIEESRVQGGQ